MVRSLLQRVVARSSISILPTQSTRGLLNQCNSRPTSLLSGVSFFSSDTHDDFAPKRKVVDGADEAMKIIEDHVKNNHIMLYMKGKPSQPQCGFSGKTIQILQKEGVDFSSVNVLDYPTIRDAVKKYSQWPTIPQLYVNGEFIGGCDIITSMHESGELKEIFDEKKE
mmetsp:Transcript_10284/g.12061  ORF Transcript_10284/g.12061 Transcript_10284/m.12061 type:complete len:167 (+) Transcript_10284:71-571(+)